MKAKHPGNGCIIRVLHERRTTMAGLNTLTVNVMVTILTVIMVVLMPAADRFLSRKLGLSLDDGISVNPKADRLLHLRRYLLIGIFAVYVVLVGYVVLFSRSASEDYLVHIALFEDLTNAIRIDMGVLEFIRTVFREGIHEALRHVAVFNFDDISQVYLNVCMFIPMGYLLPYVFDWFRRNVRLRTVTACLLFSFLIENVQLITRRGFYDVDDLITNTLGGYIGVLFHMAFAYVLTHPDWREELKERSEWNRNYRDRALTPFFRKIHLTRCTVFVSDQQAAREFYGEKLGFRLKKEVQEEEITGLLYEFGRTQIEVRCSSRYRKLPVQNVTIACNYSEYLKQNLKKHDIPVSEYQADIYTGLRTFSFEAPGNTTIVIIEE